MPAPGEGVAGPADDDDVAEDCETLVNFYESVGFDSFANDVKAMEIIGSFKSRAERTGEEDWRELMYAEFVRQRGVDPRLAMGADVTAVRLPPFHRAMPCACLQVFSIFCPIAHRCRPNS